MWEQTITELWSTKYAAEHAEVSVTYFRQLAAESPPIQPHRIKGSVVLCWTPSQVREITGRRKGRE